LVKTLIVVGGIVLSVLLLLVAPFKNDLFLFGIACFITALFFFPLAKAKKRDAFSIMSWLFYSVFLGIFLRSAYISFDLADYDKLNDVFLLDKAKSELLTGAVLVLIGSCFLIIGYLVPNWGFKKSKNSFLLNENWSKGRYVILASSLVIVSLFSLLYFIQSNGGILIATISAYRGVADDLTEINTQGYLRWLIALSGINVFFTLSWLIKKNGLKIFSIVTFLISLLIFIFFNFFVSQRTAIVFAFLQIIAVLYYSNNYSLPKIWVGAGLFISLFIFQFMSLIRFNNGIENVEDSKFSVVGALEPAILATNFVDISKTAHIVNAIPDKLPFAYGQTYSTIFFAWIPRSIWPSKPVSNVDNTIGIKVFGANTYGSGAVPPGLFAELYWNFWYPGVFIGCFLVGIILKRVSSFFQRNMGNRNFIIIYVVNFMFIGISFLGSSFTSILIGVLQTLIPTTLFLKFVISKKQQL
jgi:oligosaccharide repeat unit polymerase